MLARFKFGHAAVCAVAIALAGCATTSETSGTGSDRFSFAVIGDLGYEPHFEPQLERVLEDINRTPLAFLVHVGDLASAPRACADETRRRRLAQLQASAHPAILTPGDNDWTDCHEAQIKVTTFTPEERLENLREMFFGGRTTLGQRTFALQRQSDSTDPDTAEYRENVRWSRGGVVFITLHIVGSNNNRGRTASGDQEYARRMKATIKWLREGFRHAGETNARAVMILTQANVFFENTPLAGGKEESPSGFSEIRAALEEVSTAFKKPVMLVHGDTHYFRIDKPLSGVRNRIPPLENFTRVETFGQPSHHWVQITVEPDDPSIFTVRQRIVPANVFTGRAASQR